MKRLKLATRMKEVAIDRPVGREAVCAKCGETFIATEEIDELVSRLVRFQRHPAVTRLADYMRAELAEIVEQAKSRVLVHGFREDGSECGGKGCLVGTWR